MLEILEKCTVSILRITGSVLSEQAVVWLGGMVLNQVRLPTLTGREAWC
jgi:hypothetical protein